MLQPGRCPSSHFTEDSGVLTSSFGHSAAQIVAHHFVFWHDSLLLVDRHSPLTIRPHTSGRLTVPSEPSSIANTAMHPHHRPSCILRAPHPSETHACRSSTSPSRSSLPPSALQPRLHGASHLKDSEHITASSTTSRRPRVHPAPHHRLLVSALFYCFPRIVHIHVLHYSSSVAIAGLSRARLLAIDIKNYGHIGHFIHFSFCASLFIPAFHVSMTCVYIYLAMYLVFSTHFLAWHPFC